MSEEFIEDIITEGVTSGEPSIEEPSTKDETVPPEEVIKKDSVSKDETDLTSDDDPKKGLTIEELATQIGWNPDHKGDDSVDAATYILKSREIQNTMKANNKDLKNQLSSMQSSIEALKEHNERVYKAELKQKEAEITKLKKEKLAAVELADVKKVTEIDNQIESIQKDLSNSESKKNTVSNPEFEEWIKDNQWYLNDNEMAIYAEAVADQYPGAPRDRVYKIVRQKVAEVFPERFDESKKVDSTSELKKEKPVGPASPVEAPTKTGSAPKFTKADLSPEQTTIMRQFVSQGIMTEEQYINDIAKLQES